jgi:hypothetical protein
MGLEWCRKSTQITRNFQDRFSWSSWFRNSGWCSSYSRTCVAMSSFCGSLFVVPKIDANQNLKHRVDHGAVFGTKMMFWWYRHIIIIIITTNKPYCRVLEVFWWNYKDFLIGCSNVAWIDDNNNDAVKLTINNNNYLSNLFSTSYTGILMIQEHNLHTIDAKRIVKLVWFH